MTYYNKYRINSFFLISTVSLLAIFFLSEIALGQLYTSSAMTKPLKELLNEDGSINNTSGFSGNLDPTGYQMIHGTNGEPRFLKANAIQRIAASDPDDIYWDKRFGNPATLNGLVKALAVGDSGIYVGGEFDLAPIFRTPRKGSIFCQEVSRCQRNNSVADSTPNLNTMLFD